jgi:hypothetical protein
MIVRQFPNTDFFTRSFDTHANQWNYGLSLVSTEWVFTLDADYQVTPLLLTEVLEQLSSKPHLSGFSIPFKYCVFGKPLRGNILPPRVSLFRVGSCHYFDDGHTQLLDLPLSDCGTVKSSFYHDDRKPLSRWLWAQQRYLELELNKLQSTPISQLSFPDKIRRNRFLAPLLVFLYCYFFKLGFLDGWHGFYYTLQRVYFELLLSLALIEETVLGENR